MPPEIAKTGLIDISLACSIGKSYGFYGFRVVAEVFQAKIRFQYAFGCIAQKLTDYSGHGCRKEDMRACHEAYFGQCFDA